MRKAAALALLVVLGAAPIQGQTLPHAQDDALRREIRGDEQQLRQLRAAEKEEIAALNAREKSEIAAAAPDAPDSEKNRAARLIRSKYKGLRKDVRLRYKPQRDRLQAALGAERARRKALRARP